MVYYDATLGWGLPNRSFLETSFPVNGKQAEECVVPPLTNTWQSAVVLFVDTPELFGAEIRVISAVYVKDGTVTRQVDCWDGRLNPVINNRSPDAQHLYDLGVMTLIETANHEMQRLFS